MLWWRVYDRENADMMRETVWLTNILTASLMIPQNCVENGGMCDGGVYLEEGCGHDGE